MDSAERSEPRSAAERLLAIERVGDTTFDSTIARRGRLSRLFGGQVAAQALLAASATVEGFRPPHSLHAYFIRLGRIDVPLRLRVDRVRDGRALSTRRVTVEQEDTVVFELMASFQAPEPGPDWQPLPPALPPLPAPRSEPPHPWLGHLRSHLDVRRVDPAAPVGFAIHPFWFRADPPVGDDAAINAAMLTYVSDIATMAGARAPGTNEPMAVAASIDHALWFHRPPAVDDWLLFSTETVANIGTRGTVRGTFHTSSGCLVATMVQEGLLRPQTSSVDG